MQEDRCLTNESFENDSSGETQEANAKSVDQRDVPLVHCFCLNGRSCFIEEEVTQIDLKIGLRSRQKERKRKIETRKSK